MPADPNDPSGLGPEASAALRALREGLDRVRLIVGKARRTLDEGRRHEPAPPAETPEAPEAAEQDGPVIRAE